MKTLPWCLVTLFVLTSLAAGHPADDDSARLLDRVRPGLVRVEYRLRTDKGEDPFGAGWSERCASCGRFHGDDLEDLIAEDRPSEAVGFAVGPRRVIITDPFINPRFVEKIEVIDGDHRIPATPVAVAHHRRAVTLELATPLEAAMPLEFAAAGDGPWWAITAQPEAGRWAIHVTPLVETITLRDDERLRTLPSSAVIVDAEGRPVTLTMSEELPAGRWSEAPSAWRWHDRAAWDDLLRRTRATLDGQVRRVQIRLRSPKQDDVNQFPSWMSNDGGAGDRTRIDVAGVLYDERHVLVLADLAPEETARLEGMQVFGADGTVMAATFAGTLKDLGALIGELESPIPGDWTRPAEDIDRYRRELLVAADVRVHGEKRTIYCDHVRISSMNTGWRQHVFPVIAGYMNEPFLYDTAGRLVAIPLARRLPPTSEDEYGWSNPVVPFPTTIIRAALAAGDASLDPHNVPLSEAEADRVAWLGVELQPLGQELARLHDISDQTFDGETGAMVIHVYEGSPAERMGIGLGDILIRLHPPNAAPPMEIDADGGVDMFDGAFPWDRWGELPEQYFDQIPPPWPSARNALNTTLTALGFGSTAELEVLQNGAVVRKPFSIEESPPHYDSGANYKSEELGVTARNLTYEVRRYFRMAPDEPGVILAKIEPGGEASGAGLKPYELIISVDGDPIATAGDLEAALETAGEHRLFVKRMTEGRTVMIETAE